MMVCWVLILLWTVPLSKSTRLPTYSKTYMRGAYVDTHTTHTHTYTHKAHASLFSFYARRKRPSTTSSACFKCRWQQSSMT
ncbi:hypothetical protein QBC41DRAFT_319836 [Cercophora samala]|uniref:Secreted protein n=1 Tax=Cercophora samala TaxID=330535 RepID=A0AA39ZEI7_9PEZI|nr:hypothetical protein QBC41DRAFT_319836 [Cercophora samala]